MNRISQDAISYRKIRHLTIAAIFLVLAIVAAIWLASRTREVLTLLAISVILAVALKPTVDRISLVPLPGLRRNTPRALAILLIYLLLAVIAGLIGLLVVPEIVNEIQKLISSLPDYLQSLDAALRSFRGFGAVTDLSTLEQQIANQLLGNLSQAFNVLLFAVSVATGLLSIGVVLVLTFFLLIEADPMYEHAVSLVSPRRQDQTREMTAKMGRKIEGWLKGTLLLAVILGAATTVAMFGLGMPFPHLLGLAAAIFELVPILGPYLGAAPAVIVAIFTQPLWKTIAVVAYFIVIQQIENNVLAPHIFGRQAEMPPLLVILALLFGAALMGIVGALLSVPVAAILQVIWTDLVVTEIRRRQVA